MSGPTVKRCGTCGREYDERAWSQAEALGTEGHMTRRASVVTDYRRCACGDGMARVVRAERRAA